MRHRLDGLRPRTQWLVSFALFSLLSGCWSLASPLFSGPDEPAHVVNAAAVVRGQLLPPLANGYSMVRVPAIYASSHGVPGCFIFRPPVPASCAPHINGSSADVTTLTSAGRYPPLYYLIVGLPTVPIASEAGVYLMRLLGCLLCSGFLAGALSAGQASRSTRWLTVGVAVAVSPMVMFLAGTVNPNSLEIAAALCVWTCGIVLSGRPPAAAVPGLVAALGGSACVLALTRGLSPIWLLCIGTLLLLVAGRSRVVELWRRVDVRRWTVGIIASTLTAVAWVRLAGTNHIDTATVNYPMTLVAALRASMEKTDNNLRQMVGLFGWVDTSASTFTYYLWFFALGLLVLAGLGLARGRLRLSLGILLVAVVVLPVVLESLVVPYLGLTWQGRYTLPIAVGVPLLSAYVLGRPRRSSVVAPANSADDDAEQVSRTVLAALALGHVVAFLWALRRYTVGAGLEHKLDLFHGRWQPPMSAAGLSVVFAVAVAAYAGWLGLLVRRREGAAGLPSSSPLVGATKTN